MRQAILTYALAPEEKQDPHKVWGRPDKAFFSAGACHILAFAFLERYPDSGFDAVLLHPGANKRGFHVYVTNGLLAFDAQGYCREIELVNDHEQAYQGLYPSWSVRRVLIRVGLQEFCVKYQHRPPEAFLFDPWPRAQAFLELFPRPLLDSPHVESG